MFPDISSSTVRQQKSGSLQQNRQLPAIRRGNSIIWSLKKTGFVSFRRESTIKWYNGGKYRVQREIDELFIRSLKMTIRHMFFFNLTFTYIFYFRIVFVALVAIFLFCNFWLTNYLIKFMLLFSWCFLLLVAHRDTGISYIGRIYKFEEVTENYYFVESALHRTSDNITRPLNSSEIALKK